MNPEEALNIIKEATEPQSQGKITRVGYAAIQQAIETIEAAIKRAQASEQASEQGSKTNEPNPNHSTP